MSHNLFNSLQEFKFGGKTGKYYSLPALEKAGLGRISRLPVSLRVVLESALRNFDGKKITENHLKSLSSWKPAAKRSEEVPIVVARVRHVDGVDREREAGRADAQRMVLGHDALRLVGCNEGYAPLLDESARTMMRTPGQACRRRFTSSASTAQACSAASILEGRRYATNNWLPQNIYSGR